MTSDIASIIVDFAESFTLLRRGLGVRVKGRYSPGVVAATAMSGATWPTTGPERMLLPEGVRTQAARTFVTASELQTAREPNGHDADCIVFGGEQWAVAASLPWSLGAFWQAVTIKRAQSDAFGDVYFGAAAVVADEDAVVALSGKLQQPGRECIFTATAGAGQYLWLAYPAVFGAGTFRVDNFVGGVSLVDAAFDVGGIPYRLHRSVQANLGTVTLQVE